MALGLVLVAWAVGALVFVGLGRLAAMATGAGPHVPRFWLGWALGVALLQVWHLAWPVDGAALGALAALAAAGWWIGGRPRWRPGWADALAFALTVLVADQALAAPGNLDTDLYFAQTVAWAEAHPVTPGLGNLNHRLAFNHAYYLYAALADVGPLEGRGHHVANGLLFVALLWPGLRAIARLASAQDVVRALVLVPLADALVSGNLTSPAADGAVFAYGAALAVVAARMLVDERPPSRADVVAMGFLGAAGVVTKASLVCVEMPLLVAVLIRWVRSRPGAGEVRRVLAWSVGLGVAVVGVWMARGVVLSGYPLFPSTALAAPVPWRVPEAVARMEMAFIRATGRLTTVAADPDAPWVGAWLRAAWLDTRGFLLPVALAAVLALALVWTAARGRLRREGVRALGFVAAAVAGLSMWWWLSPELRHAGVLVWLLPISLTLALVRGTDALGEPAGRAALRLAVVVLALGAFVNEPIAWRPAGVFEELPPVPSVEVRLESGDVVLQGRACRVAMCVRGEPTWFRMRRAGEPGAGFEPVAGELPPETRALVERWGEGA